MGLSNADYHADDSHESQTRIKVLDESAALYEARFITKAIADKDTDDKRLGRCLHVKVLQPDLFNDLCPIMPDYHLQGNVDGKGKPSTSKSTTYYQTQKKQFEAENAGKDVIDADDLIRLRGMANAIWQHEEASFILSSPGENEVQHRWFDRINRRCMFDAPRLELREPVIADVKGVQGPPTPACFARNAAKWRWWVQHAWYIRGATDLWKPSKPFLFRFILVNKDPPHEVAIHQLDDRPPEERPWLNLPEHFMCDMEWADWRTEQLVTELMQRRESGIWQSSFQRVVNKTPLPRYCRSNFYSLGDDDE